LGFVTHKGKSVKPSHKTVVGEEFEIQIPEAQATELIPMNIPLEIAFEDEHLIVVNKPSGLVVHPACGHTQDTMVNALLYHAKSLSTGFESGRPGIVHRLDKDTSGLLVVAKNDRAHRALAAQFKKRLVHRIYFAVCYGEFHVNAGTVRSYLRRHPNNRKKIASVPENMIRENSIGKLAITHYTVIKKLKHSFSLLHLKLETGRTHQIRVHMAELRHPIVADPIYGRSRKHESVAACPHLLLHAAELGFLHPVTNEQLKFTAPWPNETLEVLKSLGAL
jgi:23S rRNA pseudouridine1911/1915/1917 synthase